jgi:hypothetical protein
MIIPTPTKSEIIIGHSQYRGAVATWSLISMRYFLRILDFDHFDQVATAPCTDCVQVRFLLLRQSRFKSQIDLAHRNR